MDRGITLTPKMSRVLIRHYEACMAAPDDQGTLNRLLGALSMALELPEEEEEEPEEKEEEEGPAPAFKADDVIEPDPKPPFDIMEAKALYESGLSFAEVAEKIGAEKSTINKWFHRMGIEVRPKGATLSRQRKRAQLDTGKIKALRDAHWSIKDIAEEMQSSVGTIQKIVHELKEEEAEA